jgi:uncharacterized RDD family membrane protein YckC
VTVRPPPAARVSLQGHYAGFASRFAAYVIDAAVTTGVFMLGLAAVSYAAGVLTGHAITWNKGDLAVGVTFLAWEFVYYAYCWGSSGKTLGMAILGLRVVHRSGVQLTRSRAVVRTLAFPFSFLLLGLGFAGIVLGADRRALHDLVAGSAVIYSWDARAARLRFLASRDGAADRG